MQNRTVQNRRPCGPKRRGAPLYGTRNALAHGYYDPTAITHDYCGIDLLRVWTTVQNDLPGFAVQVRAMLLELDDIPPPDCPNPAA